MDWKTEGRTLAILVGGFLAFYFLPVGQPRFDGAVTEALELTRWYAREHVILCLLPAFLIAGAIAVFIDQDAVMRYLGPRAPKPLAYGVGAVSGGILAVCSCTVLPLFAGIYRMGAGLGPAIAFLYSGPAINALAVILTAKVLGWELGLARAIGAVLFSVVIGLAMALIFRREAAASMKPAALPDDAGPRRSLGRTALQFALLIGVLVFANWADPGTASGFFGAVHAQKWTLTALSAAAWALTLWRWYGLSGRGLLALAATVAIAALAVPAQPMLAFAVGVVGLCAILARGGDEAREWLAQSWGYAKQIAPLLLVGVLLAGFLLGRPGHEGVLPSAWVAAAVGGESLVASFFAAAAGALMYFATLTEIPILQGLIGSGMGKGPALALLLAGPSLSLPSILVIHSLLGVRKTATYILLVVAMATLTGWIYGRFIV
ncbi:permease [Fontimonas sp. SYSU GA230001]|uniref:permease n=1 Tax=Fontimonas sp. SYSU GA230001 TaxID=3142450 RepID=UPI0032B5C894